mmetsp:Transcript_30781/g.100196  ORF Transcript_30781/g.100196 Transcript_30781/m.100196 type:complete len:892 (+) Transcript_30781:91-2766(+)
MAAAEEAPWHTLVCRSLFSAFDAEGGTADGLLSAQQLSVCLRVFGLTKTKDEVENLLEDIGEAAPTAPRGAISGVGLDALNGYVEAQLDAGRIDIGKCTSTVEELQHIRRIFQELDADTSGRVGRDEMRANLARLLPELSSQEIEGQMGMLLGAPSVSPHGETKGEAGMDFLEFYDALVSARGEKQDSARIDELVDMLDLDKSGALSQDELRVVLAAMQVPPQTIADAINSMFGEPGENAERKSEVPKHMLAELLSRGLHGEGPAATIDFGELFRLQSAFRAYDSDGSGLLGADELPHLLQAVGLPHDEASSAEFLDLIDADNDGTISWGEFLGALGERKMLSTAVGATIAVDDSHSFSFLHFNKVGEGNSSFLHLRGGEGKGEDSIEEGGQLTSAQPSVMERLMLRMMENHQQKMMRAEANELSISDPDQDETSAEVQAEEGYANDRPGIVTPVRSNSAGNGLHPKHYSPAAKMAQSVRVQSDTVSQEQRLKLRRGRFKCLFRAFLVSIFSALVSATCEGLAHKYYSDEASDHHDEDTYEYQALIYGPALLCTVIEVLTIYHAVMVCAIGYCKTLGIELYPPDPERLFLSSAIARCVMEAPHSFETILGVNPLKNMPHTIGLLIQFWSKARVGVVSFAIRTVLRRVLVRFIGKEFLPLISVPIIIFFNVMLAYRLTRDVLVLALGPHYVTSMFDATLSTAKRVTGQLRIAIMRTIAVAITYRAEMHPMLELLLRHAAFRLKWTGLEEETSKLEEAQSGGLVGSSPTSQKTLVAIESRRELVRNVLPALSRADRLAVVRVLSLALVVDGLVFADEKLFMREVLGAAGFRVSRNRDLDRLAKVYMRATLTPAFFLARFHGGVDEPPMTALERAFDQLRSVFETLLQLLTAFF